MQSHDRTLLARLGFQDPDKQNPLHDLACQYIARKRRTALAKAMLAEQLKTSARLAYPLSKGEGQFKTTIGFLDVWISCRDGENNLVNVGVEVKIAEVTVGDLMQQLNLYREYANGGVDLWAVVVAYPIKKRDVRELLQEGVFVAQLGPQFDAWAKSKAQTKKAKLKAL